MITFTAILKGSVREASMASIAPGKISSLTLKNRAVEGQKATAD
jgi:hypothetical protein